MPIQVVYDPILGKMRMKDASNGGGGTGSDFDPAGIYPNLIAGGLIGKDTDAVQDNLKSWLFRTTAGGESVSDGYAKVATYRGNVVNGIPFNATSLQAIGFNCYNPNNKLANMTINASGELEAMTGQSVVFIHVIQGVSGSGENNGYVVRSAQHTIARVGYSTAAPTAAGDSCTILTASTHGNSTSYLPTGNGYLWIAIDDDSDLMAHLAWSGYRDSDTYEEYSQSSIALPMCHTWGMAKAGAIYDEVNQLLHKKYTRVQRTMLNTLTWEEHQTSSVDPDTSEETISYSYTTEDLKEVIKASTTNFSHYGLSNACVLSVNSEGKITIASGTVQQTPATSFACYLYFEMATPVEEDMNDDLRLLVSDFGTEELIGATVAPLGISMYYLSNLTDFIRDLYLNRDQDAYIVEKISFINSPSTIYVTERNLVITDIKCYGGNAPKLNGNAIAVGSTIAKDTIYTLSLTMTDNSAMIILKTQSTE